MNIHRFIYEYSYDVHVPQRKAHFLVLWKKSVDLSLDSGESSRRGWQYRKWRRAEWISECSDLYRSPVGVWYRTT